MSLRDRVKAVNDIKSQIIEIPEWDEKVEVRSMSARTRADMLEGGVDPKRLYARVIIATCFEPGSDEPAFSADDEDWLLEKNAGVIADLAQIGLNISGFGNQAVEEGKDGSSTTPSDDITSG